LYQNDRLSAAMTTRTIRFGDEGQLATRQLLRRLDSLASYRLAAHRKLRDQVAALESLERTRSGSGPIAHEGVDELVAAIHTHLAHWEAEATRRTLHCHDDIAALSVGVALWAIRHEVPIEVAEPVANALAWRSNHARSKRDLAAAFALMQGVIANVAPRLSADLERSNPERPWRILHANLAITAIRTEDPALMDAAFDALDAALPDERATFYGEALALAMAPGIAPAVKAKIESRLESCQGH
jgi:hypothetical protein